jgi:RNA polymerase sigma-70 factor (sigma-E family)
VSGVPADDDDFSEFVRSKSRGLLRTAWLLAGDSGSAEDLVQAALAHTWVRWDRIRSKDAAEAYVQRVMVTTFLGWRRRRWTAEVASASVPDVAVESDATDQLAVRDALVCAVRALPPHQRAVVALRYFNDLSETATAEILGCSVGAVKSQSFRAMQALRATPGLQAAISGESV